MLGGTRGDRPREVEYRLHTSDASDAEGETLFKDWATTSICDGESVVNFRKYRSSSGCKEIYEADL